MSKTTITDADDEGQDPDLPSDARGIDKATYLQMRSQFIARLRGIEPDKPFDSLARGRAIRQMDDQEAQSKKRLMTESAHYSCSPLHS